MLCSQRLLPRRVLCLVCFVLCSQRPLQRRELGLEMRRFCGMARAGLRQLRYIVLVKQAMCVLQSLGWGGLEMVLWCSLTLLELKNLAPESLILRLHTIIQCRSAHGGTEHAVLRVQKIAAAEPREQLAEIHLHSERTHSQTRVQKFAAPGSRE